MSQASARSKARATKQSQQVFDVRRPGKSAPSATAKPIIVDNHTLRRDPMMAPESKPSTPIVKFNPRLSAGIVAALQSVSRAKTSRDQPEIAGGVFENKLPILRHPIHKLIAVIVVTLLVFGIVLLYFHGA